MRHGDYLARAQKQQQRTIEITPQRGIIYDRHMHALAMSVPVKSAFAVPAEIGDQTFAAHLLSGIVNVPDDVLLQRFQSSRAFAWVSRKLPPEKVEAVTALNLKGVYFQEENQRFIRSAILRRMCWGLSIRTSTGWVGSSTEFDSLIRGKSEKIVVMADARQRCLTERSAARTRGRM